LWVAIGSSRVLIFAMRLNAERKGFSMKAMDSVANIIAYLSVILPIMAVFYIIFKEKIKEQK